MRPCGTLWVAHGLIATCHTSQLQIPLDQEIIGDGGGIIPESECTSPRGPEMRLWLGDGLLLIATDINYCCRMLTTDMVIGFVNSDHLVCMEATFWATVKIEV